VQTIDRVLDVCLRMPPQTDKKRPNKQPKNRIMSDSENETELDPLPDGLEPEPEDRIEIDEWEEQTGRELFEEDAESVAKYVTWCFVKWDDLQYDQCE
jgi:hypothetical protein